MRKAGHSPEAILADSQGLAAWVAGFFCATGRSTVDRRRAINVSTPCSCAGPPLRSRGRWVRWACGPFIMNNAHDGGLMTLGGTV